MDRRVAARLLALLVGVLAPTSAQPQDGAWTDLGPAQRAGHATVYDPLRDRMVVFGGYHPSAATYPSDVTWTLSLAPEPTWTRQATGAAPPAWSTNFSALYDPVRDRMLVFLGGGHFGVWALALASMTWQPLAASGEAPIVSSDASAIYDPVRDRVLVFGGQVSCPHGPCPHNEVWALSLSGAPTWTQLAPTGTPPAARFGHTAIYDPVRDRMLVFAGIGAFYTTFNDAWALELGSGPAWTPMMTTGVAPAARSGYLAVYDGIGDRMMVSAADRGAANDVWSLSLGASPSWTKLAPSGAPPRDRVAPSLVYDSTRRRLLLHGGSPPGGGPQTAGETWALSLAGSPSWSAVLSPPTGREYSSAVIDPSADRMLVFGGMQLSGISAPLDDAWAQDLGNGGWTRLAETGARPAPRWGHTSVLDSGHHRMIVFGGTGTGDHNDAWALVLDGSPGWAPLLPSGAAPAARSGHVAVYDPIGDRMVVFGGAGSSIPQPVYNDTWSLSFAGGPSWTELEPAGPVPSPRSGMAAAFDSKRRRMLVFGGLTPSGQENELWVLSLAAEPTWSQMIVAGAPPARNLHSAVYDAIGDRLIVFAGISDLAGEGNAAWALSLSGTPTWSRLAPSGTLPASRLAHEAIFDAARNRMIVFGGFTPGQGTNTVHYDDSWSLAWPPVATGVPPTAASAAFALQGARPNPASRELSISFVLAERGPAMLELLDVAGRRQLVREVGELGPGPHVLRLDREVAGLPAGVYLVRLRQGSRVAAGKICVIR
jgi:galactose oxidase-like protein